METFIYLNDVGAHNGATRFVSRTRTRQVPVEEHTLNFEDYADLYDDPGDASAPAGSIVVYRPDVYHRSVDFADPTRHRFMLHVSYKPAHMEWGGYQAWPFKGFSMEWHNFVQQATPAQLTALGFPAPGHAFWTEADTGRSGPPLSRTGSLTLEGGPHRHELTTDGHCPTVALRRLTRGRVPTRSAQTSGERGPKPTRERSARPEGDGPRRRPVVSRPSAHRIRWPR